MVGLDENDAEQENLLDVIDSLFPEEDATMSYEDFVKDVVAPKIAKLPILAAASDVVETVQDELEARFGSTVAAQVENNMWEALLEKIGEDAELFLDEEASDTDLEEDIYLGCSDTEDESQAG